VSRADRVAGRLKDVDVLLVTEPANLRYVSGFTGSNGFAVVGPQIRRFVTDFRYVEQAKVEVPDFDREQGPQELLAAVGHGLDGVKRLGFDDAHLSVRAHKRLGELLPPHVELVPAAGVVEEVRAVKEPGEILRIGAAAALVDEIYAWLLEFGLVGRTERDVAVALEHEMRLRGASGPSFDSIVASAEHGALPHATPRDVAIAYCQGTPLRNEIVARDEQGLERATNIATDALARRFGSGAIEGRIRAFVVTAMR